MAIVDVTIVPIGTDSPSVSNYVAACHQVLHREQRVKYQLTPMGTVIEGDLNDILAVIRKMHEVPFEQGAPRVSTIIKIDDRRDKEGTMQQKLSSVNAKL